MFEEHQASEPGQVTNLLQDMRSTSGSVRPSILNRLLELTRSELQRLARSEAGRIPKAGWGATELLQEASLKLYTSHAKELPANRQHLFATLRLTMRRLLLDQLDRLKTRKRGGSVESVALDENLAPAPQRVLHTLRADVQQRLALLPHEQQEVVRLRFFEERTEAETARILGVSEDTVQRRWKAAKAILAEQLQPWNHLG